MSIHTEGKSCSYLGRVLVLNDPIVGVETVLETADGAIVLLRRSADVAG